VSAVVVEAIIAIGRKAFPDVAWDEVRFRAFLGARRGAQPAFARDLLLVFLWSEGSEWAAAQLERAYLSQVSLVIGSEHPDETFVRDAVQEVKSKLYAERRLLQYRGQGPLGGWIRRAALNTALVMKRPNARERSLPSSYDAEALASDVELLFLKRRHQEQFRAAFLSALQALSTRERTVLRLNALSNVSIDELGRMYTVHRTTAARWVQRARESLLLGTLEHLKTALRIDESEARALMADLRSQLDISLRHYGDSTPGPSRPALAERLNTS